MLVKFIPKIPPITVAGANKQVTTAITFITSFIFNVLVAALIVFIGDQLGVGSQMTTAVVVVLGIRIFANVAALRRHIFKA